MKIKLDKRAKKGYQKLNPVIKNKANKKLLLLDKDIHHPQLRTKKVKGTINERWEARIDYHYRFTFVINDDTILILSIGMHDEGLGKK